MDSLLSLTKSLALHSDCDRSVALSIRLGREQAIQLEEQLVGDHYDVVLRVGRVLVEQHVQRYGSDFFHSQQAPVGLGSLDDFVHDHVNVGLQRRKIRGQVSRLVRVKETSECGFRQKGRQAGYQGGLRRYSTSEFQENVSINVVASGIVPRRECRQRDDIIRIVADVAILKVGKLEDCCNDFFHRP